MTETFQLTADDARAGGHASAGLGRVDNNYALRYSCAYGHLPVVKYLVDTFKLTASDARADNNEALRWSCENGHLPVVKYLVDTFKLTSSDVRAKNNYTLRWSCGNCHKDVVNYLRSIGVKEKRKLSEILDEVKAQFVISDSE